MVVRVDVKVGSNPKRHLTQRALDWWESARFQVVFVAWSCFR